MNGPATQSVPSLRLLLARRIIRLVTRRAARKGLANNLLTFADGIQTRWLDPEIARFLEAMDSEVPRLRARADFDALPGFGNRVMVEFAVWTTAADRSLRHLGVKPETARAVVADLGWDVYRRMLRLSSLPARLVTRDPGRRLRWTIRALLYFPFNGPGAPGYAVETRRDGDNILTHFTCCPPQSFARRLADIDDDPDTLEAFRQSWCTYDWPGADLIAGDGVRGHYRRRRTLSHGDDVCDMCWAARSQRHETAPHAPKK
ncbi:hypothetical protein DQW77_11040 [Roseovarius sp. TE539]|uniref:hypothetical protein n=1 Tax=Roseovarius sp. TE539 TaxID=2249812 RepID=UPI000DDFEBE5|nr:hypothetical protein [Roseovarius sp. TE539]RBI72285.1 hypothetical protein DQW77_11040 [Roseovarius sp. TE539]